MATPQEVPWGQNPLGIPGWCPPGQQIDQPRRRILAWEPLPSVCSGPPLKDDPKYSKYFRMLKMGLPKGAVAQAMTKDGLDAAVLDMDPNKPVARNSSAVASLPPAPRVLRKRLHWTGLSEATGIWKELACDGAQCAQPISIGAAA